MRKAILLFWVCLALLSCKKGSCEGISCLNGGWCKNGTCKCPTGFSGDRCETKWTDVVVGTYVARDQCDVGGLVPDYEFSIVASNYDVAEVYLQGMGDLRCQQEPLGILARMNGISSFTIPRQSLCNRTITLEGWGEYSAQRRELIITYRIEQGSQRDSCRISAWRK
ncbi:MAG: calcium-binding EGF-like domain-containing protein [Bacteroidia bacterium]